MLVVFNSVFLTDQKSNLKQKRSKKSIRRRGLSRGKKENSGREGIEVCAALRCFAFSSRRYPPKKKKSDTDIRKFARALRPSSRSVERIRSASIKAKY